MNNNGNNAKMDAISILKKTRNNVDSFYSQFFTDLKNEIMEKYDNENLKQNHKHENKFGLDFGITGVSNNYRVRLEKKPGVRLDIVVDSNKKNHGFFDYLKKKENIVFMESEVSEKLEVKDNKRYKRISLDYSIDLNENPNEKIALDYLSSKAILLMEAVLKLYNQY